MKVYSCQKLGLGISFSKDDLCIFKYNIFTGVAGNSWTEVPITDLWVGHGYCSAKTISRDDCSGLDVQFVSFDSEQQTSLCFMLVHWNTEPSDLGPNVEEFTAK